MQQKAILQALIQKLSQRRFVVAASAHRCGRRGRGEVPPKIREKYFCGQFSCKIREFVNFSGKNHLKMLIFHTYFSGKNVLLLKLTEFLRMFFFCCWLQLLLMMLMLMLIVQEEEGACYTGARSGK